MSKPERELYEPFFQTATKQYDLPANLLRRVAEIESGFNSGAVSPKGATGLMQIMPNMHPDVDATDPYASIDYAGKWLSELHKEFGSWDLALAAYNAGPGAVTQYGGIPPFEETQNYVKNILGGLDNIPDQRNGQGPEQDAFSILYNRMLNESGESSSRPDLSSVPEEGRGFISRALGAIGNVNRSVEEYYSEGAIKDITSDPKLRTGAAVVSMLPLAGASFGVVRRWSAFRTRGLKLAKVAEKAAERFSSQVAPATESLTEKALRMGSKGAERAASRAGNIGYSVWSKGLGGANPSRLAQYMNAIPEAEMAAARGNMFLSLQENVANAVGTTGRLSAEAQRHLMSPAGQARLVETFKGLPPEYLDHFNRLVTTGQHQTIMRWLLAAGPGVLAVRGLGRSILEPFMGRR